MKHLGPGTHILVTTKRGYDTKPTDCPATVLAKLAVTPKSVGAYLIYLHPAKGTCGTIVVMTQKPKGRYLVPDKISHLTPEADDFWANVAKTSEAGLSKLLKIKKTKK